MTAMFPHHIAADSQDKRMELGWMGQLFSSANALKNPRQSFLPDVFRHARLQRTAPEPGLYQTAEM
jgi:hypothetical protein